MFGRTKGKRKVHMGFFSFLKKKKDIENTEFAQITVEEALKQYNAVEE